MKLFVFLFSIVLFTSSPEPEKLPKLENSYWSSEFYFYRNVYGFSANNKGVCYEYQIAASCPIDLKKHKIAEDSMLLMKEKPFVYSLNDSSLLISFDNEVNPKDSERKFSLRREEDGGMDFISTYEYAYGREVLSIEPIDFRPDLK